MLSCTSRTTHQLCPSMHAHAGAAQDVSVSFACLGRQGVPPHPHASLSVHAHAGAERGHHGRQRQLRLGRRGVPPHPDAGRGGRRSACACPAAKACTAGAAAAAAAGSPGACAARCLASLHIQTRSGCLDTAPAEHPQRVHNTISSRGGSSSSSSSSQGRPLGCSLPWPCKLTVLGLCRGSAWSRVRSLSRLISFASPAHVHGIHQAGEAASSNQHQCVLQWQAGACTRTAAAVTVAPACPPSGGASLPPVHVPS